MNCRIAAIEYCLPKRIVTNEELFKENPDWNNDPGVGKVGVYSRHISGTDETALDLSMAACNKLLSKKGIDKKGIGAIISCTQSPDYLIPSNSYLLHSGLNLPDDAFALDINLACSGFVYALAVARSLINTYGLNNIVLVTADTYSKYIHPKDKSVRLLFGDGAAAILLEKSNRGIIDIKLGSFGKGFNKFHIPAGGSRLPINQKTRQETKDGSGNIRTQENIYMEGFSLVSLALAKVPQNIKTLLSNNGLGFEDIRLFIFHQASQAVLDTLVKSLAIPEGKVFNNLSRVGNLVSASIPVAIKDALDQGRIGKKDKLLICGFGAGFSWGSAILEWQ